ncbi:hypothetical protein DPMN_185658 [Dreissena polymorpha]|uniref:Uncharacterized protein n=2 Tax=Dreissena polymorpha TaxID=45954 RepID=A0A9D4DLF8_DREPO|nr:hypothetical protein DPMN_185658 [Dreissena polymorpha]
MSSFCKMFPFCSAFTNLALNKAATQTDTHIGGDASLAVDGSSFQASSYADSGCTRTVSEDASWEVDLGDLYVINQVKIINRLGKYNTVVFPCL